MGWRAFRPTPSERRESRHRGAPRLRLWARAPLRNRWRGSRGRWRPDHRAISETVASACRRPRTGQCGTPVRRAARHPARNREPSRTWYRDRGRGRSYAKPRASLVQLVREILSGRPGCLVVALTPGVLLGAPALVMETVWKDARQASERCVAAVLVRYGDRVRNGASLDMGSLDWHRPDSRRNNRPRHDSGRLLLRRRGRGTMPLHCNEVFR